MDIDVMLCDHAEAVGGKLFMNGGGVAYAWVQPNPPHFINLALGIVIQVPYTATNQGHILRAVLLNADGEQARTWTPDGAEGQLIEAAVPFNVGRPPNITPGDAQPLGFGLNFFGVPLSEQGGYSFSIEVDGSEERRLPFRVTVPPPGMFPA